MESTRSIPFEPIIRDAIENGPVIRVGRFTDRVTGGNQGNGSAPNAPNALKIAFRSKVVSRGHAEIWVEEGGKVSCAPPSLRDSHYYFFTVALLVLY